MHTLCVSLSLKGKDETRGPEVNIDIDAHSLRVILKGTEETTALKFAICEIDDANL